MTHIKFITVKPSIKLAYTIFATFYSMKLIIIFLLVTPWRYYF